MSNQYFKPNDNAVSAEFIGVNMSRVHLSFICAPLRLRCLVANYWIACVRVNALGDGIVLTQTALADSLGEWTLYVLTFSILLFAFSSVMYNYYLGETALQELTSSRLATHILRWAVIAIVLVGAIAPGAVDVFFFSDPVMGLLALVNLVVILMLFPTAMRVIKDFNSQLKSGIDKPVFDPAKFSDLDLDPTAWEDAALEPDAADTSTRS